MSQENTEFVQSVYAAFCRLDLDYPGYGFAVNKGYITRAHEAAVVELGLSPAHRRNARYLRASRRD